MFPECVCEFLAQNTQHNFLQNV